MSAFNLSQPATQLEIPKKTVFISHNVRDKPLVRSLAAVLVTAGVGVWFDEWEVRAGDSIPGKINEALLKCDIFVLVWSAHAASSKWVIEEMQTAISMAAIANTRVIPIILDDTPLPSLLSHRRYCDMRPSGGSTVEVASEILGFNTRQAFVMAMQSTVSEFEVRYFPGYGAAIGCPDCGAEVTDLELYDETDCAKDDRYMGARCKRCHWNDGGEV